MVTHGYKVKEKLLWSYMVTKWRKNYYGHTWLQSEGKITMFTHGYKVKEKLLWSHMVTKWRKNYYVHTWLQSEGTIPSYIHSNFISVVVFLLFAFHILLVINYTAE
jgi:hypothetical protein